MVWPSRTKCRYSGSRSSRSKRLSNMWTRRTRNSSKGRYHSRSQWVCETTTMVRLGVEGTGFSDGDVRRSRNQFGPAFRAADDCAEVVAFPRALYVPGVNPEREFELNTGRAQ